MRTALATGLLVVALAGCAEDGPDDLQASFCSDLDSGMSLAQLVPQVQDYMADQGRSDPEISAALWIDDAVEHCPTHRGAWEATATYELLVD